MATLIQGSAPMLANQLACPLKAVMAMPAPVKPPIRQFDWEEGKPKAVQSKETMMIAAMPQLIAQRI